MFASAVATAQDHYYGVKGGFSISMMNMRYEAEGQYQGKPAYHAYFTYKYINKGVYLAAEAGINQKGHRYLLERYKTESTPTTKLIKDYNVTSIGVNANAGWKTKRAAYFFGSVGLDVPFMSTNGIRPRSKGYEAKSETLSEPFRINPLIGGGIGCHVKAGKINIPIELRYDATFDTYRNDYYYSLLRDNSSKAIYHTLHFSTGILF